MPFAEDSNTEFGVAEAWTLDQQEWQRGLLGFVAGRELVSYLSLAERTHPHCSARKEGVPKVQWRFHPSLSGVSVGLFSFEGIL